MDTAGENRKRRGVHLILPNARSIIITVPIFSVSWQWTDVGNSDLYLKFMSTNIQGIYIRIGLAADTMGSACTEHGLLNTDYTNFNLTA
mgnify:FL=1